MLTQPKASFGYIDGACDFKSFQEFFHNEILFIKEKYFALQLLFWNVDW